MAANLFLLLSLFHMPSSLGPYNAFHNRCCEPVSTDTPRSEESLRALAELLSPAFVSMDFQRPSPPLSASVQEATQLWSIIEYLQTYLDPDFQKEPVSVKDFGNLNTIVCLKTESAFVQKEYFGVRIDKGSAVASPVRSLGEVACVALKAVAGPHILSLIRYRWQRGKRGVALDRKYQPGRMQFVTRSVDKVLVIHIAPEVSVRKNKKEGETLPRYAVQSQFLKYGQLYEYKAILDSQ